MRTAPVVGLKGYQDDLYIGLEEIRDRNGAGRGEAGAGRDNDGTKWGGDSVKSSTFPRV